MKGFTARILLVAVLLVLIPLGVSGPAAAEAPFLGRLVSSGHPGRSHRAGPRALKPFVHHGGADALASTKEEAAIIALTLPTSPSAVVSSTVVTGFDGIDESATFAEPPDGAIAVSATYVVEAVNDAVSVWTKSYDVTGHLASVTGVVSAADLNLFLGSNPNCITGANDFFGAVSDPSLDYDTAHDRFMVSMIGFDQLTFDSTLCVAVTETGDPSGNWFIYAFPIFNGAVPPSPTGALLDFPHAVIGADGQLYVTGNLFLFAGFDPLGNPILNFDHARAYAVKTSDLYVGSNATAKVAVVGNDPGTGLPADSLTPARAVGVSGMYFVSASNPSSPPLTGSAITLWKWSDPFGGNLFTQQGHVTVATYTQPPEALQPGAPTDCAPSAGVNCITTNDARNLAAHWFNGTIWGTHAIGCAQGGTPVACVQWYQLGNLDGAPALLQQGLVDDASPGHYRYFPTLAVDQNGSVALAYAYSSAADYPGLRYTPIVAGAQGAETLLKAGEITFLESRYGDYGGAALDPHDHLTIWHLEEYAKSLPGNVTEWGTWVSAIQIAGVVPTPDFSVAAAPASPPAVLPGANQGYSVTITAVSGFIGTVSLAVSGLPAGASGSFSPGSVTFTSGGATSATSTLTVTTTGATTRGGNYTVTITGTAGSLIHTATVTLTVKDFSVSVSPSARTVRRGRSTSATVTVSAINGFAGTVTLSVGGLPPNASASFSQKSIKFTGGGATSAASTLTIRTRSSTPSGTYPLAISATSQGVTRQGGLTLTVQ